MPGPLENAMRAVAMPRSAWFVVGFCAALRACSGPDGGGSAGDLDAPGADRLLEDENVLGDQGVSVEQVQGFLADEGSALAGYDEDGRSAAPMIVDASRARGVSPVYLLARIQTESALVRSNSLDNLHSATGCGCPDHERCNPAFANFGPQVRCASNLARSYCYAPWDQRLCLAPDGDFFDAVRQGRASIVTDHLEAFTERGLRPRSGEELEADLVVLATGLKMKLLGGTAIEVDGRPVELAKTLTYQGSMFSDVPNLAFAVGYTNASWTLKCDLTSEYVCRLLRHLDAHGFSSCRPRRGDASVEGDPIIDFSSS